MKLSIVVPVYDVEVYLPRCLDSLLRQGWKAGEYEIVCVNDGSPDGSAQILADYAERHPDIIRVITQENQGLGPARYTGTMAARGEYVAFVDSDDYLIDGAYAYLCEHFLQGSPDVVHYDNKFVSTDGKTLVGDLSKVGQMSRYIYTDGKTLVDPQAQPKGTLIFDGDGAEAYNRMPLTFTWTKIIKRSFLVEHDLKAEPVVCQDELFNFAMFRLHPHTRVVSSSLYRYEQANPNSAQHTLNRHRTLRQLDELLFHNTVIMEQYLSTELADAARRSINLSINTFYRRITRVRLSWHEWRRYHQRLLQLPPLHYPYDNPNWKTSVATTLKNLSRHSYLCYLLLFYVRPK